MKTTIDIDEVFKRIPSWTEPNEREKLSELAQEVPPTGTIVEIGCLYGGTTAVLALSNPSAMVRSIDNFSWTPEGYPAASKKLFLENMKSVGAFNVTVMAMTSKEAHEKWQGPIDLLFIDGGHDLATVRHDLEMFYEFSKVIALHDYDNSFWPDIRIAVTDFLISHGHEFYLSEVAGMVAVLRRR